MRLVGFGQATRKSGPNDGSETRRTVDTTLRALDGNLVRLGKTSTSVWIFIWISSTST